jgi:hypothetical protein
MNTYVAKCENVFKIHVRCILLRSLGITHEIDYNRLSSLNKIQRRKFLRPAGTGTVARITQ